MLEGFGENTSRSSSEGGGAPGQGQQLSRGNSFNYSVSGRALLRPDEILTLSDSYLMAFLRGVPPILARRIKWYKDPAFKSAAAVRRRPVMVWGLLAAGVALVAWAAVGWWLQ